MFRVTYTYTILILKANYSAKKLLNLQAQECLNLKASEFQKDFLMSLFRPKHQRFFLPGFLPKPLKRGSDQKVKALYITN